MRCLDPASISEQMLHTHKGTPGMSIILHRAHQPMLPMTTFGIMVANPHLARQHQNAHLFGGDDVQLRLLAEAVQHRGDAVVDAIWRQPPRQVLLDPLITR
jgi:hypothetical protein